MYPSYLWAKFVVDARAFVLAFACVLFASLCATPAHAARIPFPEDKVTYDLQGESLKSFLERFFSDIGIPLSLSPDVQDEPGTLNGPRSGTAAEVFKKIADSNQLVAYYDGSVAFVYKSSEVSSRYYNIDPARVQAFREATIGFGLPDTINTMSIKAETGLVQARGTPRFLDQLAQLSTALGRRTTGNAGRAQPKISLRYIKL